MDQETELERLRARVGTLEDALRRCEAKVHIASEHTPAAVAIFDRQVRYLFFTRSPDNKPVPMLAGRYMDEFVRENGQWKIKSRKTSDVIPYRDGNAPPPATPPASVQNIMKK